jgi:hypothetical protein
MLFNVINEKENEINDEFNMPNIQNELTEDEVYTCTECDSNIEIQEIDETNNIISFLCPVHGSKTTSLKEYFEKMPKNTFLYSKCSSCQKQQNQINNAIFKYCFDCKLILCNNCISEHDKTHQIKY